MPNDKSAQPCGCDEGCRYRCEMHAEMDRIKQEIVEQRAREENAKYQEAYNLALRDRPRREKEKIFSRLDGSPIEQPMQASVPFISGFTVKDSGNRQQFASGMVRDVTDNKIDFTLALDGPMFERLAAHLTKGAKKYAKRNWMQASGEAELERFRESALRHFLQWLRGDVDEDHAAAVFFNINGAEYVKARLADREKEAA